MNGNIWTAVGLSVGCVLVAAGLSAPKQAHKGRAAIPLSLTDPWRRTNHYTIYQLRHIGDRCA